MNNLRDFNLSREEIEACHRQALCQKLAQINGKMQRRQITLNSVPAAFVCPLP